MPDIHITVDGRPALTTAQAASRRGISPASMRKLFSRRGLDPVGHLEGLPLYDVEAVGRLGGYGDGQGKGGGRKPKT